jgi:signal peptidase I
MLLGFYKISGHSMMPTLNPSDRVIVSSIPYLFSQPKPGDIIIFKNAGKPLIKRISKVSESKFLVEGDNREDSINIGWIEKQDIIGKVIY